MLLSLVFLSSLPLSSSQSTQGVQLGFPEDWTGDSLKQAACETTGRIPSYLNGYFLCQLSASFGSQSAPTGRKLSSVFDGIGAIGSWELNGSSSQVHFSGAYYPTDPYKRWNYYGRNVNKSGVVWFTLTSDCDKTARDLWNQIPPDVDSMNMHPNVDFWKIGKEVVGATENAIQVGMTFRLPQLDRFRKYPFTDTSDIFRITQKTVPFAMPVHEHVDSNGTIWNVVSVANFSGSRMSHVIFTVSPTGVRSVQGTFNYPPWNWSQCSQPHPDKSAFAGYMHSFAATENFIILPVTSVIPLDPCDYISQAPETGNSCQGEFMKWKFHKNLPLRFLVFDKRTKKFLTEKPIKADLPLAITHQFNAYETESGEVICDMIGYDDFNIYQKYLNFEFLTKQVVPPDARLLRFRLNLKSKTVQHQPLSSCCQIPAEFSQINRNYLGKPYRYGYILKFPYNSGSQILKLQVDDRNVWTKFDPGAQFILGEPWFVPDPEGKDEDAGILLVRAIDIQIKKGVLFVVDAKNMREIARATAPSLVPFGFHNRFYPSAELGINQKDI